MISKPSYQALEKRVRELETSKNRFAALFNLAPVGYVVLNASGIILEANHTFCAVVGRNYADIRETDFEECIVPGDRYQFQSKYPAFFKSPAGKTMIIRLTRPGAGEILGELEGRLSEVECGGLLVTIRDVTEQKEGELNLQQSEAKFKRLFDVAAIPLGYVDNQGIILDLNTKFTQVFGYTWEDIPTLDEWWVLAYPDPEYREWVIKTWETAVKNSRKKNTDIKSVEYRVTCKNGDIKNIIISGTTFKNHFLATFIDLTALKLAEEMMRNIYNSLEEAVLVVSPSRSFLHINKATQQIFGYTEEEIRNRSTLILHVDQDHFEAFGKRIQEAFDRDETAEFEYRAKRKNGEIFPCEYMVSQLKDESGTPLGIVSIVRDISKRKAAEKALQKTLADLERSNNELRQFAYVASHDLQEPLRAVVGFLQLLQSRYGGRLDEKGTHYIERSVKAGRRMQKLISDLLVLSRVNSMGGDFIEMDLNSIIEDVLDDIQHIIHKKNAKVNVEKLPGLKVDPHQIHRLFLNLILNALQYNKSDIPVIDISVQEEKEHCRFRVRDNGIGISKKFHDKIFMIFQRLHTRKDYPGTGLGLALCKKIVERHNGRIWIESDEGTGSTFLFTLPKERMAV